jgi:hypothetical protein
MSNDVFQWLVVIELGVLILLMLLPLARRP